ncbi:MAG: ABC transporter substrate-binding protein, partial [Candidatus Hermodarchaeota archaeon]
FPAFIPWVAREFPDKKTYLCVAPDRDDGRMLAEINELMAEAAGMQVIPSIYYPPDAVDLSAVGTKVKTLNPDIFEPYGGGPMADSAVMKATHAAGYRGQIISGATIPGQVILGIAGAEPAEGFISLGWPQEFDLAPNELAQPFKADYIAKFGKWDDPETVVITCWWILKDAMMKADSTDPDKIAEVIASGLKHTSPNGNGQMVNRPDLGQNRTVMSCIGDVPIKKITGGQVVQIGEFKLKDVLDFVNKTFGSK